MTNRTKTHRVVPAVTVVAIGLGVAAGVGAFGGSSRAANAGTPPVARCVQLASGGIPQAKLEASYRKLTLLGANTSLVASQPRRYGACGSTHYAFELLTVNPKAKLTAVQRLAQQNHAPLWHQNAGGQWIDPPLASLCKLAPTALIKIWSVGVTC